MIIGLKQKLNHLERSSYVIPRSNLEKASIDIVTETKYHSLIIDDNLRTSVESHSHKELRIFFAIISWMIDTKYWLFQAEMDATFKC